MYTKKYHHIMSAIYYNLVYVSGLMVSMDREKLSKKI